MSGINQLNLNAMLKSTINRGFQITFENKLTISVQFGTGNYCERRSIYNNFGEELKQQIVESNNAEIAIWDSNETWFNFGSDTVKGYVNANEVADWIYRTKQATSLANI